MSELDYRIGLDIGTNSIGWGVIELFWNKDRERYEKVRIVDKGVRMFDKAEIPNKGASLAEPRRIARSSRRRLNRKSQRKKEIRNLLVQHGMITQEELDLLYPLSKKSIDIWDIRLDGLDRLLNHLEWARLLIHLAQRRGFKSNRKSELKDAETGKVLSSIQVNEKRLFLYRTVGEMWIKDAEFSKYDRRRNSPNEYVFSVSRADLEKEIVTLFEAQRKFQSSYASKNLQETYLQIWAHQLPFASGNAILNKVGYCSLLKGKERRIPKATYTFQYFSALDQVNRTRLGPDFQPFTQEQKEIILDKMFQRTDYYKKKTIPEVSYYDIRKWLELDETIQFKGLNYDPNEELKKIEKKPFINLKAFYEIKKVVANYAERTNEAFSTLDYDAIAYALTVYKTDKDIRSYLKKSNNLSKRCYDDQLIEELFTLSYTKFGHLSFKAINHVLPIMQEGRTYQEAIHQLGYDTTNLKNENRSMFLPLIPDEITNPIVKRALTQARKVVNAIIRRYGSPNSVHIELARELSKSHDERKKIMTAHDENYKKNKGAISILIENGILNPTGYDIVRYKLWKEQGERCAYSLKEIPPDTFFNELKKERNGSPILEVDHILPYSQSFIDSYHNKVLVYSDENRNKGNRIPYTYFLETNKDWEAFERYVRSNKLFSKKKREYLLKKAYLPRESELIKERHLNDTRYASTFLKNFIEQNLQFKEVEVNLRKKRVQTVNGVITAHLRKRWGLEKNRQETYLHHAMDAIIVACTDHHMVTRITEYYQIKESNKSVKKPYFPMPWEGFRDELLSHLASQSIAKKISEELKAGYQSSDYIFVSRMPKRSVTGAAHDQTIRRKGGIDKKGKTIIIKRVRLKDIKFDENGDFKMVGKEQDLATYEAIKQRYLEHRKNSKKAFETPLYKPSKKGTGNLIKRVKIEGQTKAFVREVNGGVAQNSDLVRVDLFEKDDKYYMVPIYVPDTVCSELPKKVVKSGKGYEQWLTLDNSFTFKFSLYPYDLVRLVKGNEDRFLYFGTLDIDSDRLNFKDVNKPSKQNEYRYSLKTIENLEKYEVGVLGDLRLVKQETRRIFNR
ncbi:type II CRISPR RNA-guided endonuclease Cas9 [Bacillus pseudomycoides]|uniref:type II CRISPR RNA-guided endonuclease Cas9 n=1 Tax=Bacillus pseudomycoides TaxID=64104 RepID=UPI000BEB423D|nr:type II CRISPR RNA-guided endonuclease Cas9 [Bacillus pseudomycoides]PEF73667.1 type II CRISPR RNA-guided endonuclease Cas9 [Bacillus pseudomycoides]PEL80073.1 type II CRISPR RNA-guided endonuclease Cas9 [Bacillus pseudomycoides]